MNQVIKVATAMQSGPPIKVNPYYPRFVLCADGASRIVQDHLQHSALTGIKYGPDAQPIHPNDASNMPLPEVESMELAEDLAASDQDPVDPEPEPDFEPAPIVQAAPVKRRRGPNKSKLKKLVRQRLAERKIKSMVAYARAATEPVVEPEPVVSEVC